MVGGHATPRRNVSEVLNVEEMRQRARWLPRAVFDAIDGGATDEVTLRANRSAFERIWLRPRALADVERRDISTTVFGQRISMPLMLDPCGFARMANSQAELAVARAAGRAGTIFAVSGVASYSLEEIANAASGPAWYQLYLAPERDRTHALINRVERAGYSALVVTIDSPVSPKRERDYRNKLTVPLKMSPRLLLTGLTNPLWTMDFILGRAGRGRGFSGYTAMRTAMWNLSNTVANQGSVTAADVRWIRDVWKGKLLLKGVMRGDECEQMVDLGVDGIIVSNHGGRQIDGVRATIDILPEVVKAVGGRIDVFVDSGIRRGTDVVKAIALGARACLIGRPYMFGLAVAGEAGVARVLEIFKVEIEQTMGLVGCATVSDIDSGIVEVEGSHPSWRESEPASSFVEHKPDMIKTSQFGAQGKHASL